jgi:ketosteroid isomerase-like protein
MNQKTKLTVGALALVGGASGGLHLYHRIVERLVREIFTQLSAGNYEYVLPQMASRFEHFFSGTHPLGGRRHTLDSMRRWFERLYRLNKQLRFEILGVAVSGTPWNTFVVVEWIDRATLANGEDYLNQGVHFVRMSWGKVTSLHAYLDTQEFAAGCERMAAQGIEEAAAAPIAD